MKAYIDRVLIEEIISDTKEGSTWNTGEAPPLRKVKIVSAGDTTEGIDNSHLNGKEAYIKGEVVGLPIKYEDRTLHLIRLYQLEIIND